jgi:hypothetical protein
MANRSGVDPPSDEESDAARFAALVDAPLTALGLPKDDADALQRALGVKTVRELADNRYVRRAQAIVHLANARQ